MLPDRVSNPGPLTYESGAIPIALRGPLVMAKILFHSLLGLAALFRGDTEKNKSAREN